MATSSRTPHDFIAGERPSAAVWDGLASGFIGLDNETSDQTFTSSETAFASVDVHTNSGKKTLILANFDVESSVAGDTIGFKLKIDGTLIHTKHHLVVLQNAAGTQSFMMFAVINSTGATNTYSITGQRTAGTGTIKIVAPAFLLVIDIGSQ